MRQDDNQPLRVLLWCWGRRGGGPHYTLQVARALGRIPILDVHLSISRQSELLEATRGLGLPTLEVDTFSGIISAFWRTLTIARVARRFNGYLDTQRIDLVLCTMCHPWSGWIAPRIRSPQRAYIVTVHDAKPHPGDALSGWKWLLRANLRCADGTLLLSEHVREQLLEHFHYPPERTWVIPHGPISFRSDQDRDQAPKRVRSLLFFGRILPYKGLTLLLDAFLRIADRYDLHLLVAGHGKLDTDSIRKVTHPRISVDNRWIPENELAAIFDATDLVVIPYFEASQSGVVAAAYGMGLPVVVTPVGGLREQVKSGETGLIAADTTSQALADAIETLCKDSKLFAQCCEGARRAGHIEEAWDDIALRMADLFRQISSESKQISAVHRQ